MRPPNEPCRPGGGGNGSNTQQASGAAAIVAQTRTWRDSADRTLTGCPCGCRFAYEHVPLPSSRGGILAAREHLKALGLASEHTDDLLRDLYRTSSGDPGEHKAHDERARGAA